MFYGRFILKNAAQMLENVIGRCLKTLHLCVNIKQKTHYRDYYTRYVHGIIICCQRIVPKSYLRNDSADF